MITTPFLTSADELSHRRWTREEYYRVGDMGPFLPRERLELIQGEIVKKMSPQSVQHAFGIRSLEILLGELTDNTEGGLRDVRAQMPITLSDNTEPEPDLCVVRGRFLDYEHNHPKADDILLVVEVSDVTLGYDQTLKAQVYAEARIAEYWILDLPGRRLEVRRDPVDGVYQSVAVLGKKDAVAPLFSQIETRVSDVLPRGTSYE